MEMIGKNRKRQYINSEELGLMFDQVLEPDLAVVLVFPGNWVVAQEKATPDNAI